MNGFTHEKPVEGAKDEWLTPPWITQTLGPFDLDPCAPCQPPWGTATQHYCICDNGLTQQWPQDAFIWCNPPYGKQTFIWLDKLSTHPAGGGSSHFCQNRNKRVPQNSMGESHQHPVFTGPTQIPSC